MAEFDPDTATADELWDYCLVEYSSNNPISKWLLRNYYSKIRKIVDLFGDQDRILEIGCGAGASSRLILDMLKGQEFQVSEFDERYIIKLKETNFPLPIKHESVLDLERDDNEFDCVFLLEVLEHIEEYEIALSEIFRVSSKYVVISVPNEPLWRILNLVRGKYIKYWGNTPTHINHWSPIAFNRLISKYGFVVKTYIPIPWTIVLAEVNKF